jgi:hypothetical protein
MSGPFEPVPTMNEAQLERRRRIASAAALLQCAILDEMPADRRERALALTKLDELFMWASRGIAFTPRYGIPEHPEVAQ